MDPTASPTLSVRAPAGWTVVLRLTLRSRLTSASLVRPVLEDWVDDGGGIHSGGWRVEPGYVYLLQGGEGRMTLTCPVPERAAAGSVLRSGLRFPGTDTGRVSVELEVLPAGPEPRRAVESLFRLDLPFGSELGAADLPWSSAEATYALVAGLAGFDLLPSRWLVAELLTAVVLLGAERAETKEGAALLDRLGRTSFFKNGVLAFTASRVPAWVGGSLASSSGLHAALGGQAEQGQILYMWERWLLGLAGGDIESGAGQATVSQAPLDLAGRAAALGPHPDRWFASLIVGLGALSPRIAAALEVLAGAAPDGQPPVLVAGPPPDVLGEPGPTTR